MQFALTRRAPKKLRTGHIKQAHIQAKLVAAPIAAAAALLASAPAAAAQTPAATAPVAQQAAAKARRSRTVVKKFPGIILNITKVKKTLVTTECPNVKIAHASVEAPAAATT
eukprot:scpid105874/ scgid27465/ 